MHNLNSIDILEAYLAAMEAISAERLAELYDEDAVHEFPFAPGIQSMLRGKDEIFRRYREIWSSSPVRFDKIEVLAVHNTRSALIARLNLNLCGTDDETFAARNVLVMEVRDSRLWHVRDYIDNEAVFRGIARIHRL